MDDFGGITEVGWAGLGHSRPTALVGILDLEAPGQQAGLRSGDRVTAVAGEPVEDWYGFAGRYAATSGSVELTIVRGLGDASETSTVEVPAPGGPFPWSSPGGGSGAR